MLDWEFHTGFPLVKIFPIGDWKKKFSHGNPSKKKIFQLVTGKKNFHTEIVWKKKFANQKKILSKHEKKSCRMILGQKIFTGDPVWKFQREQYHWNDWFHTGFCVGEKSYQLVFRPLLPAASSLVKRPVIRVACQTFVSDKWPSFASKQRLT